MGLWVERSVVSRGSGERYSKEGGLRNDRKRGREEFDVIRGGVVRSGAIREKEGDKV